MSLSFLVPLFLLGVAGIVVPILVHLTRRQRKNVVAFPSLMFLQKIPFQEQRRRRIQNWLLLSLRALALGLLALAFARPFLDQTEAGLAGSSGPREVVVLLDRSYSMDVGSQFADGVRAARSAIDGLGPLDRASLVVFGQGAQVVARSTSDRLRLGGALDTARVGSGTTRFGPALKVAQTILEESDLPGGEVVLISDFQDMAWSGDEGVRLPAGAVVTPVDVRAGLPENHQVADVGLTRQTVNGRERLTPTARVVRRGGEEAVTLPVALELDGQEIQTVQVTLAPDGVETVVFQPFTLSAPHTRGTVRIPGDGLPADDARHFVVSPGGAMGVLVVEGAAGGAGASLYLERALEISEEGRFRVRVARQDLVRAADLDGVDVVVLNDTRLDGASAERLRDFVRAGGGVLLAAGEAARWPSSAEDLLPGTLGAVEDRDQNRGGRLGFLEYGHPVFEAFSGPRSGDFTGARFFRARGFVLADSADALARFDDGSVALAEQRLGRGTVLVWTSTLDGFWNDLALQPVYLPFVHRLVDHAAGRAERLPWFTAGQVVDLADPDALETAGLVSAEAAGLTGGGDAVALTPSGSSVPLPGGDMGPRYLPLDERGFYTVRPPGADPDRPFVLAVNVDLDESVLTPLDPAELVAQITAPPSGTSGGPGFTDASALQREDQERRQSLWRYVLLGAFGLLALETVLSNWVSRRTRTPGMAGG